VINLSGPYDPTTPYPQNVDTTIGEALGALIVHNLSPYELGVVMGNGSRVLVAAWSWRRLDVTAPTPRLSWQIVATPNQAGPPLSVVFVEGATEPDELPPNYFGSYTRQTSIGNQVSTTSSNTLINDGASLGTQILESTPQGYASSFLLMKNDGTLLVAAVSNGTVTDLIQVTPGGASTAAALALALVTLDRLRSDGGNVTTDGAGNLAIKKLTATQITSDGGKVTTDGTGDLTIGGNLNGVGFMPLNTGVWISLNHDGANGSSPDAVHITAANPGGGSGAIDLHIANLTGGWTYFDMQTFTAWIDSTGAFKGSVFQGPAWAVVSNGGSATVPQLETSTAGAGLAAKQGTAGIVELYPTAPASTQETIQFDWQDSSGTLHAGPQIDPTSATWHLQGQLKDPNAGKWYPLIDTFTGTGAGTYSYTGFGIKPTGVYVTSNEPNSTQTVGVDSLGTTSVHIDMPNAWPFYAAVLLG
jgi:hypothetical protein